MSATQRRKKKAPEADSRIVAAAEAMGKAVGSAVAALESTVGRRRRPNRPSGYEKLQMRRAAERKVAAANQATSRGRATKTGRTGGAKKRRTSSQASTSASRRRRA